MQEVPTQKHGPMSIRSDSLDTRWGLGAAWAVLQAPGPLSGIQNLILGKRAPTSSIRFSVQPKGASALAHWG